MVQDSEILPEFREVFLEESEELVSELGVLTTAWLEKPEVNEILRDIRRHFHTFKGNGRAVGANILGELGWAAQDMLDRSLDGELLPGDSVQRLVNEVVIALPSLVESYSKSDTADVERIRKLTKACFAMASCEGQEQAEKLPEIMDVIGFGNSVAEQTVVVETVTY
jgi:chemotaxis protein histidine kinase CheA